MLLHFWVNEKVVTIDPVNEHPIRNVLCVDTSTSGDYWRYGYYKTANSEPDGWKHVPLREFPKEFRMQLLLMGVS